MKLVEYSDREALIVSVANKMAGALRTVLSNSPAAGLAVAGGTTPGPIFDDLCAADLDWSRVKVMPTDERWVPEDDPRSNSGLIRSRLLVERAAQAEYVPLFAPADTPEDAAPALAEPIRPLLPLAVVLLGMGADMHTASLFPDTPGLDAALAGDAPILSVLRPQSQPETRISLSAHVLNGALEKHLVITGADKRAALEKAQSLPVLEAPVRAVLSGATVHWSE